MAETGAQGFGEGTDENAFHSRLFTLTEELETAACALNPDYAAELEDGSHGCVSAKDIGDTLRTDLSFNAVRIREELGGNEVSFPFAGRGITSRYALGGTIGHVVSFAAFPEKLQAEIRGGGMFDEELADDTTEYSVDFEQSFEITSDGEFRRILSLRYLIDDCVVGGEPDDEDDDDEDYDHIPLSEQPGDVVDDSLKGLENIFSDNELEELVAKSSEVLDLTSGKAVRERMQRMIAEVRFASRMRQLELVSGLIRQIVPERSADKVA